jgi:hypothetical protein
MHTSDFKCRKTSAASILAPEGKTAMNSQEMMMMMMMNITTTTTATTTTTFINIDKTGRRREGQKQTRLGKNESAGEINNSIYDPKIMPLFKKLVYFLIFTLICYRYSTVIVQISGMVKCGIAWLPSSQI